MKTATALKGLAALLIAVSFAAGTPAKADSHLGTIKPARATWDTGWFQLALYTKALEAIGYTVEEPKTLDNPIFYQSVAQGDVDFWVNGWFPLHNPYQDDFEWGAEIVGYVARGGALQGYLVDKKSADEFGITSIEDFKRDEVKEAFDIDGNGMADLVACPPGWGCELVIEHHLDAYDLRDHIDPIKAAYSPAMGEAIARYEAGDPIFFYTWTPNWTVGLLKPGQDVVWIQVPFASLPEDQEQYLDQTTIPDVTGCTGNPCNMGFPANDIRPVANSEFLEENPAARKLLEVMEVPLLDIFEQNAKMFDGEDKAEDLERHADEWIKANQEVFDGWVAEAKAAM